MPPTPLPPPPYIYDARLVRVVDGDTIVASVSPGFRVTLEMVLRLAGLNCPERDQPGGMEATAFTAAWLAAHGDDRPFPLRVATTKDRRDPYGRYLASVRRQSDGRCLNDDLLAAGMAVPYIGGKTPR